MIDIFQNISYDLNDKRFLQLKEELTAEMKEQFNCEDYDKIVEYDTINYSFYSFRYILKCVFENKQSKQSMITSTQDMFQEKTETVFNFLWNCTNKIYPSSEDIVKDKDNEKAKQQTKPLFASAIEEVKKRKESRSRSREREEKRGDTYPLRGGYNNTRGRFIRGGFNPYQRGRGSRFIRPPIRRGGVINEKSLNNSAEKQIKNEDIKASDNSITPNKEEGGSNNNNNSNVSGGNNNNENQPKNNKKKVRCKNWPQCKETNCEYSHPTETVSICLLLIYQCPYFPTCIYGVKCIYIHPNIPCKFGYYCTRLGCNYSHPAGWNPGMPTYQMQYQKKYYKKSNQDD